MRHQEALLALDLPLAGERLDPFERQLRSHIGLEEERLLPLYGRQVMYSVLAEAVAGEQVARRLAMKLASDNASDMVNLLTRQYNRARQALITKEIAEILGGAEALKD